VGHIPVCSDRVTCDDTEYQLDTFQLDSEGSFVPAEPLS
jgi:hypothetical protein